MASKLENLGNLSRRDLRRLAAEALLISDGPDATVEYLEQDGGDDVVVYLSGLSTLSGDPTGTLNQVTFDVTVNIK